MVYHGYFSSSKNTKEVASILNAHMHSYAMANIRFDIPFTSDKFSPIHTSRHDPPSKPIPSLKMRNDQLLTSSAVVGTEKALAPCWAPA